jgi:hypothetical protein
LLSSVSHIHADEHIMKETVKQDGIVTWRQEPAEAQSTGYTEKQLKANSHIVI